MDEAFFQNTREFLPWDINNGTATLPYLAFEKFLDLVGVPRVLEHVLVSESVLTTSFELPFIAQVLGRLIDLGLFEGWPKHEWLDRNRQPSGGPDCRIACMYERANDLIIQNLGDPGFLMSPGDVLKLPTFHAPGMPGPAVL